MLRFRLSVTLFSLRARRADVLRSFQSVWIFIRERVGIIRLASQFFHQFLVTEMKLAGNLKFLRNDIPRINATNQIVD